MPPWVIALLCVAAALGVAAARFAHEQRRFRAAARAIHGFWTRFWAGRAPVAVRVVGPPGARVTLGRLERPPARSVEHLVSTGFALRTDDGHTVEVPAGTAVALSAPHHVVDARVEVPAGLALMARLDEALAVDDGPHRSAAAPRVPADGLMLSDEDLRVRPAPWAWRATRWSRWAAFVAIGGAIVAATAASTAFVAAAYVYLLVLGADALLLHGGAVYLACSRPAAPPDGGTPPGPDEL